MATATETLTVTEVKQAMGTLKLGNRTEELLDEIELDRQLKISEEHEKAGRTITIDELERRVNEKVANGFYRR